MINQIFIVKEACVKISEHTTEARLYRPVAYGKNQPAGRLWLHCVFWDDMETR